MARDRGELLLGIVVGGCLVWAAVEARQVDWRGLGKPVAAAPVSSPAEIEGSFAEIRSDLDAGTVERALLSLRRRTEHGPHPGTAWFLLGEVAYDQGAHGAAVRHYRRAVEEDPAVADQHGAFRSGQVIGEHLTALLEGPWAADRPPEVRDLYYLQRRLGGGCE